MHCEYHLNKTQEICEGVPRIIKKKKGRPCILIFVCFLFIYKQLGMYRKKYLINERLGKLKRVCMCLCVHNTKKRKEEKKPNQKLKRIFYFFFYPCGSFENTCSTNVLTAWIKDEKYCWTSPLSFGFFFFQISQHISLLYDNQLSLVGKGQKILSL